MRASRRFSIGGLILCATMTIATPRAGQGIPVRHPEGLVHGFLTLSTLQGARLADGDLIQHQQGDRVTSKLSFRFKDGSHHEETAVYSQRQQFRLLTYQLTQRGRTFPRPLSMTVDTASGHVTVKYTDEGREKTEAETLELPSDLANGMVSTLLKNVRPDAAPESMSYVAATPDPRLVRLEIHVAGAQDFSTGGTARKATHFVLKVKIGGFAGLVAPLLGKDPPDVHVWILGGDAPAFVRAEQPLYTGGPVWRIELTSPVWK
jgi:hypothetical protein